MIKSLVLMTTIFLSTAPTKVPSLRFYSSNNGFYVATNPLNIKVEIIVNCGIEYEKAKLYLWPHTREEIKFKGIEGEEAACLLESWHQDNR